MRHIIIGLFVKTGKKIKSCIEKAALINTEEKALRFYLNSWIQSGMKS